jgi:hypothetical protein
MFKEEHAGEGADGTYGTHGTNGGGADGRVLFVGATCGFSVGLCTTLLETDTPHALPEPAFVNEVALLASDLSVEEIIGLVDQTDRDIRDHFTSTRLAELPKVLVGRLGFGCQAPTERGLTATFLPQSTFPCSEKILIIVEQLFEACTCCICQFDLSFLGRTRSLATL